MLQRVRKADHPPAALAQPDPLDMCLDCWKSYQHGDSDRNLSAKTMHGLTGIADAYGISIEEAQQAHDSKIGAATDAMIDSMSRLHIWAIYKLCGMATPWRFDSADLLMVGPAARADLTVRLKANVACSVFF